jgi:hypothetical protein
MNIISETIAMGRHVELCVNHCYDQVFNEIEVLNVFLEFPDKSKIDVTEALDIKQIDYIIKSLYNDI